MVLVWVVTSWSRRAKNIGSGKNMTNTLSNSLTSSVKIACNARLMDQDKTFSMYLQST